MINIETNTGLTRIKLLDNPFVNEWKQHFIKLSANNEIERQDISYPYIQYQKSFVEDHIEIRKPSKDQFTIIDELNELGTNFQVTNEEINN